MTRIPERQQADNVAKPPRKRALRDWCPLDEVDDILRKRCVVREAERTAICLWVGHTYIFSRGFTYTPRLFVTSHTPSCGKSALLRLVAAVSDGGIKLEKGTTLPVIRDLRKEGQRVTLCLDQMDGTGKGDKDDAKLINLLCSSFEIGAKIGQKEKVITKKSERFETVYSDIGFPTALGKIGNLPDPAIMSRCVVIHMQPETEAERAAQMAERQKPIEEDAIREKMRKWLGSVKASYTKAPKGTESRTEDIWQPLFAVAKHAGPGWVARAEAAIQELGGADETAEAAGLSLLRRVYEATKGWEGTIITGPELDEKLTGDWTPKGVQRGKVLKAVGLKSWPGKDRHYRLAEIREMAVRNRLVPEHEVAVGPKAG